MAKRNRYRELESLMTKVLIGGAAVFVLYMISAAAGWTALKVLTAIVTILGSLLGEGWLYLTGEMLKVRSRWMAVGFAALFLCTLFSLILNFPCPPVTLPTT